MPAAAAGGGGGVLIVVVVVVLTAMGDPMVDSMATNWAVTSLREETAMSIEVGVVDEEEEETTVSNLLSKSPNGGMLVILQVSVKVKCNLGYVVLKSLFLLLKR